MKTRNHNPDYVDLYLSQRFVNYSPEVHQICTSIEWTTEEYFQEVVNVLKENKIKSFLDVGGCTGEVSNVLLENVPTIESGFIFEPVLENYNFILQNVKSDKVIVENKAIFFGKKSIEIFKRNDNVGGWSALIKNIPHRESVKVDCVNIDDYLRSGNVDFIKMDIEGSEFNVIKNSSLMKGVKFIELELHHEYFFDIYKKENDLEDELIPLDFVKKYLPNHEVHCFLDGVIPPSEESAGNVFLIKK